MTEEHPEIHVARDVLDNRKVAAVVVASISTVIVSVWVTWALLVRWEGEIPGGRRGPRPPQRAPMQISNVNQTLIEEDYAEQLRTGRQDRLQSFEWSDREQGTVKIPIRRAMELRAKGVTP